MKTWLIITIIVAVIIIIVIVVMKFSANASNSGTPAAGSPAPVTDTTVAPNITNATISYAADDWAYYTAHAPIQGVTGSYNPAMPGTVDVTARVQGLVSGNAINIPADPTQQTIFSALNYNLGQSLMGNNGIPTATLTVTYTMNGVQYTVTFKCIDDIKINC